jgi:hypothetical protein
MSVLTADEHRRLRSHEFHGFGPAPLPDRRDALVAQIIDRLVDGRAFRATAEGLGEAHRQVFAAYAARASSLAVRGSDEVALRRALLSVSLSVAGASATGGAAASGEALLEVPLPLRAAELIGADPRGAVRRLVPVIGSAASALEAWVRDGGSHLVEAVGRMGYEEDGEGPTFRFRFGAW